MMNLSVIASSWRDCPDTKRIKSKQKETPGKSEAIQMLKKGKAQHLIAKLTGLNKTTISRYAFDLKNHLS